MKTYLTCPIEGTLVKISFERSDTNGAIVGVRECSHLKKVGQHKCEQVCVTYLNERVERLRQQHEANLELESQTKDSQ